MLFKTGANVDACSHRDKTARHRAARYLNSGAVDAVLRHGADETI